MQFNRSWRLTLFAAVVSVLAACRGSEITQSVTQNVGAVSIAGPTVITKGQGCPAVVRFVASGNRSGMSGVFRWSSSVPTVGTIDSVSGDFTPLAAGFTTITARDIANADYYETQRVEVRLGSCGDGNGNGVLIVTPNPLPLIYGQSGQLTVTKDGASITATWTTSDATCATVDANGLVTALQKTCTAVITATQNGATGSSTVNVVAPSQTGPTGFSFNPLGFQPQFGGAGAACTSQPHTLVSVFTPSGTSAVLTYSSSNPSVVTVNAAGQLSFVGVGTARITGTSTDGQLTAFIDVTVVACNTTPPPNVTSVTVTPSTLALTYGQSGTASATVNGTNLTDTGVNWSVSGELGCVSISPNGNNVTITALQHTCTTSVVATSKQDGTKSGSVSVSVTQGGVTGITVTPPTGFNPTYCAAIPSQTTPPTVLTVTTTPA